MSTARRIPGRRARRADMAAYLIFVIVMIAGVEVGQAFPFGTGLTPAVWPASGLMLAALLPLPRRRWPVYVLLGAAVIVGSIMAHGRGVASGLTFAAITLAEAAAGAWVLQ